MSHKSNSQGTKPIAAQIAATEAGLARKHAVQAAIAAAALARKAEADAHAKKAQEAVLLAENAAYLRHKELIDETVSRVLEESGFTSVSKIAAIPEWYTALWGAWRHFRALKAPAQEHAVEKINKWVQARRSRGPSYQEVKEGAATVSQNPRNTIGQLLAAKS